MYLHIHMYTDVCVCVGTQAVVTYKCVHVEKYMFVHVCGHVYGPAYTSICMQTCVPMCAHRCVSACLHV